MRIRYFKSLQRS